MSGAADAGEAAAVRTTLGDAYRVSDGILGDEAFVAKVTSDTGTVRAALSSRSAERRVGPIGRPTARQVVDTVLELLEVDATQLEQRPRARGSVQAKRLAIWVWLHEYRGQEVDVARVLGLDGLDSGVVSYHYGEATKTPAEFDEQASAVVALLRRRHRTRSSTKTKAAADGLPVRYIVDVQET